MDTQIRTRSVLRLVNLARAAYGAPDLKVLVSGQPHRVSACAVGRSLSSGVEDWLFVAVGSKYLRLGGLGKDTAAIAEQILTAWEMPRHLLTQPEEKLGCVILPLRAEIREFIDNSTADCCRNTKAKWTKSRWAGSANWFVRYQLLSDGGTP
jgi:hypothetical protein